MEFSSSYTDTMRRLISNSSLHPQNNWNGCIIGENGCPRILKICIKSGQDNEIPTFAKRFIVGQIRESENKTYVVPLSVEGHRDTIHRSGADTAIKDFSRCNEKLIRVMIKDEVYYGTNGIILDKDFDPLFLSTVILDTDFRYKQYNIYLHPKVFTDDKSSINKNLAKKATAFLLSASPDTQIIIKDVTDFLIFKSVPPSTYDNLNSDINKFLKENIGDVLSQISRDDTIWHY